MNDAVVEQTWKDIQVDKRLPPDVRKLGQFQALVAVAKLRGSKHASAILNCFSRLVTSNTITQLQLKDVINSLSALSEISSDIDLKVLQILPLLFSSTSIVLSGDILANALKLPVALLQRPGIVGNVASATLQQVLATLFDNPNQAREADVSRIFEDLCASFLGNTTGFVSFQTVKVSVILESIESILSVSKGLFDAHPSLLEANLMPIITMLVRDSSVDNALVIRAFRICNILLPSKPNLLSLLLENLTSMSDYQQTLTLECLVATMEQLSPRHYPSIVKGLLLFEDSIPGLGSYNLCVAPRPSTEQVTIEGVIFTDESATQSDVYGVGEWCKPVKKMTSYLHTNETVEFDVFYKFLLLLDILSKVSRYPDLLWRDLLVLLSAFLSASISLACETRLLTDFGNAITALNLLEDKRPRDLYLRRLGRIAISSSTYDTGLQTDSAGRTASGEMTHRSFQCLDTFLKSVRELCNDLDQRAWCSVLQILSSAELLLRQRGVALQTNVRSFVTDRSADERKLSARSGSTSERSRLSACIRDVFSNLKRSSDTSFRALLEALCAYDQLPPGSPLTEPSFSTGFVGANTHNRMNSVSSVLSVSSQSAGIELAPDFVLARLQDLILSNIFRFTQVNKDSAWDVLVQFLREEIRTGNFIAAELLSKIILAAARLDLDTTEQQSRFVHALNLFVGNEAIEHLQLQTVAELLAIVGHDLSCGWDVILDILSAAVVQSHSSSPDAIRTGFSSLQLICTDLVEQLPSLHMPLLIETVAGYSTQGKDFNIALSAVSQFWTILSILPTGRDFTTVLVKEDSRMKDIGIFADLERLWLLLMKSLIHVVHDERPEIRNSAIQACFQTIEKSKDLGISAWISTIHILLAELHQISSHDRVNLVGYVESVTTINSGTGRVLASSYQFLAKTQHVVSIWQMVTSYLTTAALSDDSTISSNALQVLLFQVTSAKPFTDTISQKIWDVEWQSILQCGEALVDPAKKFNITQDSLSVLLDIFLTVCASPQSTLTTIRLKSMMNLVYRIVSYSRSSTYYLDIDYMSSVQKNALRLIETFFERCTDERTLLLFELSPLIKLASAVAGASSQFVFVKKSSATWAGRPTYVAFTIELQGLISQHYDVIMNSDCYAMSALIDALNTTIEHRLVRQSVSTPSVVYDIWKSSVAQIIIFADMVRPHLSSPMTAGVWPMLLSTMKHFCTSHTSQPEDFVLASLNTLHSRLIADLGAQEPRIISQYTSALYLGSWFDHLAEMIEPSTESPEYYPDQIIREWCFLELFKMSILSVDHFGGTTQILGAEPSTNDVHTKCADASIDLACKRARNILLRNIENSELRGHAPMPKTQYSEMLLLLDHLSDDSIVHANQRLLLKATYDLVVDSVLVCQRDVKLLTLLRNVLKRVGDLL